MSGYYDRPRRRRRDDWDDDDYDDRPRGRQRAPKYKSQTSTILGVLCGTALILLLGGMGIFVFLMLRQAPGNAGRPVGGGSPAPNLGGVGAPATSNQTIWVDFRQPEGLYSVKLPVSSTAYVLPPRSQLQPFGADQISTAVAGSSELACYCKVLILSPQSLDREQKALNAIGGNRRQVNWLGRVAVEESDPNQTFGAHVVRTFLDGNRLFVFDLSGFTRRPTPEEQAMFFNSVAIGSR